MPCNRSNSVNGTGTYSTGAKKEFFGNSKANHSSITENQMTEPDMIRGCMRLPNAQTIIENLVLVDETDLPFVPDTVESIVTLLDVLIGMYRSIRDALEPSSFDYGDLVRLDVMLVAIEELVMRLSISDEIIALDSLYSHRSAKIASKPLRRDLIQRDILRITSLGPSLIHKATGKTKADESKKVVGMTQATFSSPYVSSVSS